LPQLASQSIAPKLEPKLLSAMTTSRRKKIGVLFSGGLDSAALVNYYLKRGYEVVPVYIRGNLPWENVELYWTRRFLKALHTKHVHNTLVIKLYLGDAYKHNWSQTGKVPGAQSRDQAVFLPARNLTLLSRALLFLPPMKVYDIALATLDGNPFPDGKSSYFKLLSKVFSLSIRKPFHIHCPFRAEKKFHVISQNAQLPLHLTFSCINPKGKFHCGKCNKCAERKRAFKKAGVKDATVYARG
jgi:7-cyano-7-deazaguanine synthase